MGLVGKIGIQRGLRFIRKDELMVNAWVGDRRGWTIGRTIATGKGLFQACLLLLLSAGVARAQAIAQRGLPVQLLADTPVSVTIDIFPPPSSIAMALEDGPPAGWVVSNIDQGGAFDSQNGKVKWGPFFDPFPSAVHYTVTPPAGVSGDAHCFAGQISVNGLILEPIGGDACVFFDCNSNGVPDAEDITNQTSSDANMDGIPDECQCTVDTDCADGTVCTFDACSGGVCSHTARIYGDLDGNGVVTVFDLFCMLQGFSNDFSVCSLAEVDISPCSGDGLINVNDLFALLDALSAIDACCSGP